MAGGVKLLGQVHYHDELVTDFGANPSRQGEWMSLGTGGVSL